MFALDGRGRDRRGDARDFAMQRLGRTAAAWAVGLILTASATSRADGDLPIGRGVGEPVVDFRLTDAGTGEPVKLYSFRGSKAVVLFFAGTDCPVGNLYM